MPAWVKAIIIIAVVALGAFAIIQLTILKVQNRFKTATTSPATVAPTPPPRPKAPTTQGSRMFSFDEQSTEQTPAKTPATAAPAPTPAPPVAPAPKPTSAPATTAPRFHPVAVASPAQEAVTDEAINAAIAKGVDYLFAQFANGKLKENPAGDDYPGRDALAVLDRGVLLGLQHLL